jgi:DNA-binding transcriptional MerR regulator
MLIGQLVQQSGLSKDTIRFYEKHGLIAVSRKERRSNNYKEYSTEILQRLLTIKRLKNFGFTLNEVAGLLEMIKLNEASCNNVSSKISEKITLLNNKIQDLMNVRTLLINGVKKCTSGCSTKQLEDNCPILVSDKFVV